MDVETAREIVAQLPESVEKVGVFVDRIGGFEFEMSPTGWALPPSKCMVTSTRDPPRTPIIEKCLPSAGE